MEARQSIAVLRHRLTVAVADELDDHIPFADQRRGM
jgi:hypothetical protein